MRGNCGGPLAMRVAFFMKMITAETLQHIWWQERGQSVQERTTSPAQGAAVGLLDHYFFNIEFSHMVALFWGVIGLAMTIEAIENRKTQNVKRKVFGDALYVLRTGKSE